MIRKKDMVVADLDDAFHCLYPHQRPQLPGGLDSICVFGLGVEFITPLSLLICRRFCQTGRVVAGPVEIVHPCAVAEVLRPGIVVEQTFPRFVRFTLIQFCTLRLAQSAVVHMLQLMLSESRQTALKIEPVE